MDKLDYGIFPYVILLLCSNSSSETINKLDPAYLRNGRIDFLYEMK